MWCGGASISPPSVPSWAAPVAALEGARLPSASTPSFVRRRGGHIARAGAIERSSRPRPDIPPIAVGVGRPGRSSGARDRSDAVPLLAHAALSERERIRRLKDSLVDYEPPGTRPFARRPRAGVGRRQRGGAGRPAPDARGREGRPAAAGCPRRGARADREGHRGVPAAESAAADGGAVHRDAAGQDLVRGARGCAAPPLCSAALLQKSLRLPRAAAAAAAARPPPPLRPPPPHPALTPRSLRAQTRRSWRR